LGHPRSGTSWVGATLGAAANALYLYEPVNLHPAVRARPTGLYPIDPANPPPAERAAADRAFAGLPAFPAQVVRHPAQWRLAGRAQRRLVIKEVNVMAAEFFIQRYDPLVVLLVRHPAAVALSYQKLGWWGPRTTWRNHGENQGRALRRGLDALEARGNYRVVVYEELCLDPAAHFQALCAFAGLAWDAGQAARAQASALAEAASPYAVVRDSPRMARAWDGQVAPADLAELRAGFACAALPWYAADEDW
jgi:hypothetical protein